MRKLRYMLVGIALGAGVAACGPDTVNNYYGAGGGNKIENPSSTYNGLCGDLCDKVWLECASLPGANFNLGTSYADCVERCPAYVQKQSQTRYAEKIAEAVEVFLRLVEAVHIFHPELTPTHDA